MKIIDMNLIIQVMNGLFRWILFLICIHYDWKTQEVSIMLSLPNYYWFFCIENIFDYFLY